MDRGSALIAATLAIVLPVRVEGQRPPGEALYRRVENQLATREQQLIVFRRDIHQHPEISGQEERTAKTLATRLTELGLEVRTRVGGHGVVGIIRGKKPGPMVAFRADMDAVPSTAPDPVDFRSVVPGVRHICGHDLHATIGLALAEGFSVVRDELAGSVMLVFQPAEERATGAKAMLADQVFAAGKPVAIYAVHTAPLEVGQLGTAAGGLMAGRDGLRVKVTGTGNVSAAVDSARQIVLRASTVTLAQALQPTTADFVFVQAGPARVSSPTETTLEVSLTMASADVRARVREQLVGRLANLRFGDVVVEPIYREKWIAGVTNDPGLVERANARVRAVLGDSAVVAIQSVIPAFSEDFGSFQDQVPGVMYFLGVSNAAKGTVGMPHSPNYVADEAAILVGARAMAAVILDRLSSR